MRRCAYVFSRPCPVDVDEIPLDVCRICIDAWKTSAEIQSLTGVNLVEQTIAVGGPLQPIHVTPSPQVAPPSAVPSFDLEVPDSSALNKESYQRLHELDALFIKDNIDADEYVKRRREIVNSLYSDRRDKFSEKVYDFIELDENFDLSEDGIPFKRLLPLLVIEKKRIGLDLSTYPHEYDLPSTLSTSKIKSIYNIFKDLKMDDRKLLLQFNGTKLGLLGRNKNRILCVVLEGNEEIENYKDEIEYLSKLLSETTNFDDFLKALPDAINKTKVLSQELT
ncbi:MAG: hypothetical protein NWE89_07095 [Candidatus Bathyarchaeota archaeon]|nr:hypothetical protein [Candidatus Bathyarchaeota archaeon]